MLRFLASLAFVLAAGPAFAHGGQENSSFLYGLLHPLGGADHLLAMVTVGLWAALAGGRALWLWPLAFVSGMVAGGALGMNGTALPLVEPAILASTVVLGALTAFAVRAPLALGVALIAAFGLFHGHAHGAEMPALGQPFAYAAGFVLATAALHLIGLGAGRAALDLSRPALVRLMGAGAAVAGLYLSLA